MFYVYILKNDQNLLYVGQTNNLKRRLSDHCKQRGAKYTKDTENLEFVYSEEFQTRAEAMHREKQLKKWSKAKKLALISGDQHGLKQLSRNHQ